MYRLSKSPSLVERFASVSPRRLHPTQYVKQICRILSLYSSLPPPLPSLPGPELSSSWYRIGQRPLSALSPSGTAVHAVYGLFLFAVTVQTALAGVRRDDHAILDNGFSLTVIEIKKDINVSLDMICLKVTPLGSCDARGCVAEMLTSLNRCLLTYTHTHTHARDMLLSTAMGVRVTPPSKAHVLSL